MSITRATEQNKSRPSLVQIVQRMTPEIARALPKHMDADRMARLALTVIRQTPALGNCSPESFAGALLTASALGLEPGVNGEAYLVPYKSECQLIIGYQGMIKLFWQHPLASHIDAQIVHENDEFDYELGLDPMLRHKPSFGDRGKPIAVYAVAGLTTGARVFEVLTIEQAQKLRGTTRAGNVPDPQLWMLRKTAIRQLVKRLPRSAQLANAAAVDERTGSDLAAHKVPEQVAGGQMPELPQPAPEAGPEPIVDQVTGEVVNAELVPDDDPWARS
jgi:recombination protein RecT